MRKEQTVLELQSIDATGGALIPTDRLADRLRTADSLARHGWVTGLAGTVVRARVPEAHLGEMCAIRRTGGDDLMAEVVGFDETGVLLMPLGRMESVGQNAMVIPAGRQLCVACGDEVRGRVLDAVGRPLDGLGPIGRSEELPLVADPPNPLSRTRIREPLHTGVKALDGLLTVGRGQRVGIFAAAGAGKSTLLAMIARNVEADSVVLALIGERGREVRPFIEDDLGAQGLSRCTVVVSTSDQPALLRLKAAYTATAIAEARRRRGERVVLLMDSVTRFARALREVGLAAGEPPGREGYPPWVFATLPQLFERAGNDDRGSITAFYTVLVTGDDLEEPVSDEAISLLDGHVALSRRLAARGQYPAIDILQSKSRVMSGIVDERHREAARKTAEVLALYEENYDKITCGVYEEGSSAAVDDAIRRYPSVVEFLKQDWRSPHPFDQTVGELEQLTR